MAVIYCESDADLSQLEDETVAVIGFGGHGCGHAMNPRAEDASRPVKRIDAELRKIMRWLN